ncbi:MAG: alpha-isopropylmalate synthase regulatory domain-containing protein, partial [Pseudomonadota bacterium]
TSLPLGKHSGRAALRDKMEKLGYPLEANQLADLFVRFKDLADRKKEVEDDDLIALMKDEIAEDQNEYMQVKSLRVVCGTEGPQQADLVMTMEGEDRAATATGDGPVDATFNAVKELFPHGARLDLYQVHAVTQGTDAQATVSVRMIDGEGRVATGQSADTDTVVASAKAYVNALNRLIARRQRDGSDAKMVSYKDAS